MRSISNRFFYAILVLLNVFTAGSICAQQYRPIATWPDETNARIEEFLNTTLTVTDRKVAVFDCDGTVFGQAPIWPTRRCMIMPIKNTRTVKIKNRDKRWRFSTVW